MNIDTKILNKTLKINSSRFFKKDEKKKKSKYHDQVEFIPGKKDSI